MFLPDPGRAAIWLLTLAEAIKHQKGLYATNRG
jgi:hypothetical protein